MKENVRIPPPCLSKSRENWKEHRKIPNKMLKNFVDIKNYHLFFLKTIRPIHANIIHPGTLLVQKTWVP